MSLEVKIQVPFEELSKLPILPFPPFSWPVPFGSQLRVSGDWMLQWNHDSQAWSQYCLFSISAVVFYNDTAMQNILDGMKV